MRKVIAMVPHRKIVSHIPKASLGAASMLISFELGLSLLIGYFLAAFLAGPATKQEGRFKSLIFTIRQYRVHLHHWLLSLTILSLAVLFNFFVITPGIFYGLLGGVMFQGIVNYKDWKKIVTKQSQP